MSTVTIEDGFEMDNCTMACSTVQERPARGITRGKRNLPSSLGVRVRSGRRMVEFVVDVVDIGGWDVKINEKEQYSN